MELEHKSVNYLPAIQEQRAPAIATVGAPTQQEMVVYQTWAKTAFESQMYKHIGKEQGIMMIILSAREYGIPPAMALNGGLKIINGQVEISSRMLESLIRRAGHDIDPIEHTDEICILEGRRCDTGKTQRAKFTIEQARQAGLVKEGGGWKKWAEDMVYARALSRLARRLFADVVGVGYVHGEISNANAETTFNDEDESTITIAESVDNSAIIAELLMNFPEHEHELVLRFTDVISKHYKWSPTKTIQECLKNLHETTEKFNTWKQKNAN